MRKHKIKLFFFKSLMLITTVPVLILLTIFFYVSFNFFEHQNRDMVQNLWKETANVWKQEQEFVSRKLADLIKNVSFKYALEAEDRQKLNTIIRSFDKDLQWAFYSEGGHRLSHNLEDGTMGLNDANTLSFNGGRFGVRVQSEVYKANKLIGYLLAYKDLITNIFKEKVYSFVLLNLKTESVYFSDISLRDVVYPAVLSLVEQTSVQKFRLKNKPYRGQFQEIKIGGEVYVLGILMDYSPQVIFMRNAVFKSLWVFLLLMVFVIILVWVFSKKIIKPMEDLVKVAEGVEPGRRAVDITSYRDDELGALINSFGMIYEKAYKTQAGLKSDISTLQDTNLKIKEAQSQMVHMAKMESLGQLVAGVAHELNNPISFIYSNIGQLAKYSRVLIELVDKAKENGGILNKTLEDVDYDYMHEDLPKLLLSCEEGAKRTRDIVNGLKNFSRLDQAEKKDVYLKESLEGTLNLLASEIKHKSNLEVQVKVAEGLEEVFCYAGELNQVFMNIILNAIHAVENKKPGKINIILDLDESKTHQVVTIKDNGVGMTEEVRKQVCEPFYTTKPLGKGTGLGLSISYGIIEKHKGRLVLESQLDVGTTVQVYIPIRGEMVNSVV